MRLFRQGLDSLSDKEGGFVLVPQTVYEEKVAAALSGNLRELQKVAPTKVKRKAERLCEVAGLTRLAPVGTKWCGNGSDAKDKWELGDARDADMCCREHDLAVDNLPPNKTRNGLRNKLPFTM
ncbi:hypothetical protein MTO96_045641 [Rhipicephalus appendiculatus]